MSEYDVKELQKWIEQVLVFIGKPIDPLTRGRFAEVHVALSDLERYREALERISMGDGVYGAQAHEYKQIARAALQGKDEGEK